MFNNDMSSEMEMSADEHVTQTPFHLEHTGNVRKMRCGARTRKVCVLRAYECRTHGCCHWLSTKLRSSISEKKKLIETRLDMRSDFVAVGDNFELAVSESNCTSRLVARTTSENASSRLFHSPSL